MCVNRLLGATNILSRLLSTCRSPVEVPQRFVRKVVEYDSVKLLQFRPAVKNIINEDDPFQQCGLDVTRTMVSLWRVFPIILPRLYCCHCRPT